MVGKLSLEERTVGHLLMHRSSTLKFLENGTNIFLDDVAVDTLLLRGHKDGSIAYNDKRIDDLKKRNPFLRSNSYYAAQELLFRAIKKNDYDIKSAILDVISDPFDLGKKRYYGIAHDVGDAKQLMFVFFHELGIILGIQDQVEDEVRAYTESYRGFWENFIKTKTDQFAQQKNHELYDYQRCLTPKWKASMEFPLLDGDRKIIEVLSSLTPQKLEEYSGKYFKPDQ